MGAILAKDFQIELIKSNREIKRRFSKQWIMEAWKRSGDSPQHTYKMCVEQSPEFFATQLEARKNSITLVNSIAKWTEQPVRIKIRYFEATEYFTNAKKMLEYWHRPHELFARAFESFIEDSLSEKGWANEYLVSGTRGRFTESVRLST